MPRITRVSPPELERELPGPQASTSVTRAPRRHSQSASQPPKAPAPTTATCGAPAAGAGGPGGSRLAAPGPAIAALCKAGDDVGAGALVLLQLDDALALGVLEQLRERAVAVVALVEGRLLALHGLLDHRAPEHVLVLAHQRLDRFDHQAERLRGLLAQAVELRALLRVAPDVLVIDELVAVVDQQVGRGVLDADTDDVLVVLLELGHQRREVAVAREDHEGVQVLLGVRQVHGIDDHLDVGAVLAGIELLRDVDELDRRLVERALVVDVALPVGIGLLYDDLALLEQPPEDQADVELADLRVAHAESDVLEIAEHRDLALLVLRPLAVGDGDDDLAARRIEIVGGDDVALAGAGSTPGELQRARRRGSGWELRRQLFLPDVVVVLFLGLLGPAGAGRRAAVLPPAAAAAARALLPHFRPALPVALLGVPLAVALGLELNRLGGRRLRRLERTGDRTRPPRLDASASGGLLPDIARALGRFRRLRGRGGGGGVGGAEGTRVDSRA